MDAPVQKKHIGGWIIGIVLMIAIIIVIAYYLRKKMLQPGTIPIDIAKTVRNDVAANNPVATTTAAPASASQMVNNIPAGVSQYAAVDNNAQPAATSQPVKTSTPVVSQPAASQPATNLTTITVATKPAATTTVTASPTKKTVSGTTVGTVPLLPYKG